MPRPEVYHAAYSASIAALAPGQTIWADELVQLPQLPRSSAGTRKNHLKDLIQQTPQLLTRVRGIYPAADTILDLVEQQFGLITGERLDAANRQAASIVDSIAQPVVGRFVDTTLAAHIAGEEVCISKTGLMQFLLEDFTEFMKGAGNGLVSIAGTLNERLLMRAMGNSGLREGTHFQKTGNNSQADLIIHSVAGIQANLGVEVKSYHARERLLRGLQDITGHKVGVGFFQEPAEFNRGRTVTLLQTGAAAIYMPQSTLDRVEPEGRAITTNVPEAFGSCLYRPIENFVTDMTNYNLHGRLPAYRLPP